MNDEKQEKRKIRKNLHNLGVCFDSMVQDAIEVGPLMKCDCCEGYHPIDSFSRNNYISSDGELLCEVCEEL